MTTGQRFGFIELETGVVPRHVWVLLYAAFATIGLATFDAFATPTCSARRWASPSPSRGRWSAGSTSIPKSS